jgi:endonuclease/exonuclease/phosphatase family metal-dependent hydrolase
VKRTFFVVAVLAATLAAVPAAEAKAKPQPKLAVMSQNLYLGSGLIAAAVAPDRPTFEQRAATIWQNVQATDFPARAKRLARLIKQANPDLLGLQEVTRWYRSPNGVKDGNATRSNILVYDFLKTLLRELGKAGARYKVAASDGLPTEVEAPTALGYDIRFKLGNVILAKRERGLRIRRKSFRIYKAQFAINTPGGPFGAKRAWVAVDTTFKGKRFRFVDTHLESEVPPTRLQEAVELASKSGPLRVKGQKILVGDLNSDPEGRSNDAPDSYKAVTRTGFQDAWTKAGKGLGLTSDALNNELLRAPIPLTYRERIDYAFAKPHLRVLKARLLGLKPGDRTPSGLWPSDHAGLAVSYRLGR